MTNIYIVRHAKVDYIPDEYSRPLSEKGKKDVTKVTEALMDKNITRVLSSPYIRAVHTIEGIAYKNRLEIEAIDDFRERKVANNQIENIEDFISFTALQWEDFDYLIEGGESLNQVQTRGVKALYDVIHKYKDENIVISTHGTLLGVLLNHFDNRYDYSFWKAMKMPDIFHLVFEGKYLKLIENMVI